MIVKQNLLKSDAILTYFLGQSSLEIHQPQHQVYTGHKFSHSRGMANTNNDSGRLPLTHLRHKKQTNRAWNNHYQLNSSSSTSLNQLHSRLAHLGLESRPYFAQTKTYHTVQEGMNAFFNCKVENIYNQTVNNAVNLQIKIILHYGNNFIMYNFLIICKSKRNFMF